MQVSSASAGSRNREREHHIEKHPVDGRPSEIVRTLREENERLKQENARLKDDIERYREDNHKFTGIR